MSYGICLKAKIEGTDKYVTVAEQKVIFYIKVIDFFDIPDEDNCQSVYIPLLGSKEYLER